MENFCAIPLGLVYVNNTWGSHLTDGHIVLKGLCLLLLVRASFIASQLFSLFLGKQPTWRTFLFYVFIFIYNSLHVSSTSCSSSGDTNCVNTTSGSCHSVSGAVSCASRKFHSGSCHRVTVTRGCIDTLCLSWW